MSIDRSLLSLVARQRPAGKVGITLTPISECDDDLCPTPLRVPPLPPHLPPIPDPEPGPDWQQEYLLGLASTLATATGDLAGSEFVSGALEHGSRALESSLR